MPKEGKVTGSTNSSAILRHRERPDTAQGGGGHQRLMNLISPNKLPSSFTVLRGGQIQENWALSSRHQRERSKIFQAG